MKPFTQDVAFRHFQHKRLQMQAKPVPFAGPSPVRWCMQIKYADKRPAFRYFGRPDFRLLKWFFHKWDLAIVEDKFSLLEFDRRTLCASVFATKHRPRDPFWEVAAVQKNRALMGVYHYMWVWMPDGPTKTTFIKTKTQLLPVIIPKVHWNTPVETWTANYISTLAKLGLSYAI